MLENVESPPYPGEGATAQSLFNCLRELKTWLLSYREPINETMGREIIPAPVELPDKAAYISQPVYLQYQHLMLLRRVRENWDHLLRIYGDDWACDRCVKAQAMVLYAAMAILNGAFVSHEIREARKHSHLADIEESFKSLKRFFRESMRPECVSGDSVEDDFIDDCDSSDDIDDDEMDDYWKK